MVSEVAPAGRVADLGDRLAAQLISLDPLLATDWGVSSCDLPDLSPDWFVERREVFASVAAALRNGPVSNAERVPAAMLLERTETEVDWADSGEAHAELQAALDSPLFRIRHCFEEMPTGSDADWEGILRRMRQVPKALAGWRASLEMGRVSGPIAARRQVEATAQSLKDWAGDTPAGGALGSLVGRRGTEDLLGRELRASAAVASLQFAELADYLRSVYLPSAPESDAVGSERFGLWSRRYSGVAIGADDHDWAATVLTEVSRDQARLRKKIRAAAPVVISGVADQLRWADDQITRALRACKSSGVLAVDGFPELDVRASRGSTYYSPPSEDGVHNATVWFPAHEGPVEVEYSATVLFHESIPGHHVEASVQRSNAALNRFQRLVYLPAHSEGWALYAERLAEEIGLLDSPRERFGCRGSQALRLASLVIDVGLHCGLPPPSALRDLVGGQWTVHGAERVTAAQGLDEATSTQWVTNMIGRPGHRASYAAGERAWLAARAASVGSETQSEFHARLLGLGPLGLGQLSAQGRAPNDSKRARPSGTRRG